MNIIISLAMLIAASHKANACDHGFFPQNDMYIPANTENAMVKNADSAVITQTVKQIYNPIFAKQGKKLIINFKWHDPAVNAFATRDNNNNPVVNITGGMLGHDLLENDGLALILCHEIGHFLGGEPKKLRGRSTKKSWSSAEGQADYFATAHCIKKVFRELPQVAYSEKSANNETKREIITRLQQESNTICKTSLCKRIAMASYNVAEVYASIDWFTGDLSLVKKDDYTVYQTIYGHPNPQCRLDTMIAALRCPKSEEIVFQNVDEFAGACKNIDYRRPRCWFYPATSF